MFASERPRSTCSLITRGLKSFTRVRSAAPNTPTDSGPESEASQTIPPKKEQRSRVKRSAKLKSDIVRTIQLGKNEEALKLLSAAKSTTLHGDWSPVFVACARTNNGKVAMEAYKTFKDHLTECSYGYFLGALSRGGYLHEAVELLESMMSLDSKGKIQPNITMYNSVLSGCASVCNTDLAKRCLHLMKNQGVEENTGTYLELMRLSGKRKDNVAVKTFWRKIQEMNALDISSYRYYIIALCETGSIEDAVVALKEMLDLYSKEVAIDLENDKPSIKKVISQAFNALLNAAGKDGRYELTEFLFSEMKRMELELNIYSYNALIRAVAKGKGVDDALKVFQAMEGDGLEPDVFTYSALVEGYCKILELDKAEDLLHQMLDGNISERPSTYTFNFILRACAFTNDTERALQLFSLMLKEKLVPDICTYTALFCTFGIVSMTGEKWARDELSSRMENIESDMARRGVQHTRQSLAALMNVFGGECMLRAVLERLREAEELTKKGRFLLDACSYNTAIYACIMSGQADLIDGIFQRMESIGIKPDIQTYNIMMFACGRSGNKEKAFQLMESIQKNHLAPDIYTYNTLIKVLCISGELDSGIDMIDTMRASGIEPDECSFNTIVTAASSDILRTYQKAKRRISLAIPEVQELEADRLPSSGFEEEDEARVQKEALAWAAELEMVSQELRLQERDLMRLRIDMIEMLVNRMCEKHIRPSVPTCLTVMAAYIYSTELGDAANALQILSVRMLGNDSKGNEAIKAGGKEIQKIFQALSAETYDELQEHMSSLVHEAASLDVAAAFYNITLAGLVSDADGNIG